MNNSENNKQSIIFAFWHKDVLQGFRADSFNTLSLKHPKIYSYSEEQVEIVLDNVKAGLNRAGTKLMQTLADNPGMHFANAEPNEVIDQLSTTERRMREWGEFEVRVHPFINREEDGLSYPEQWKIDIEIANLQSAIEIHKFKVCENEN